MTRDAGHVKRTCHMVHGDEIWALQSGLPAQPWTGHSVSQWRFAALPDANARGRIRHGTSGGDKRSEDVHLPCGRRPRE